MRSSKNYNHRPKKNVSLRVEGFWFRTMIRGSSVYLSILGHGSAGSKDKEAFYSFGEVAYFTSELGEMRNNGLDLSRYMLANGTVVLDGCQAGAGEPGRQFMFQIGRIFFGKKRGILIANLGDSMAIAGEMMGGRPRQFFWPKDFADLIPGVLPFGRPL